MFDPNLQFLTMTWQDVRTLTPEIGDRLLMIDEDGVEMVVVYTDHEWVAAHDHALAVRPTYVSQIPVCSWLPALDPDPRYRVTGERMRANPPNKRRLASGLLQVESARG